MIVFPSSETTMDHLLIALVFLFGNAVDTAVGGGGGFLILPVLISLGVEPVVAVASMIAAFSGALVGGLFRLRSSEYFHFDKKHLLYMGMSCLGGALGVVLALDIPPETLKTLISVVLLDMLLLWSLPPRKNPLRIPFPEFFALLAFFCVGIYVGMVGSGGGLLFSFIFLFLTQKSLKNILSYRLLNALAINIVIVALYLWNGKVDFTIAGIGFLASLVGGYLGVHYFIKIPEKILKNLFILLALVSIIAMNVL